MYNALLKVLYRIVNGISFIRKWLKRDLDKPQYCSNFLSYYSTHNDTRTFNRQGTTCMRTRWFIFIMFLIPGGLNIFRWAAVLIVVIFGHYSLIVTYCRRLSLKATDCWLLVAHRHWLSVIFGWFSLSAHHYHELALTVWWVSPIGYLERRVAVSGVGLICFRRSVVSLISIQFSEK